MKISVELTLSPLQTSLNSEIKDVFEAMSRGLIFKKIVKSDRSYYAAYF